MNAGWAREGGKEEREGQLNLKLEGDAADGALLDALHEVSDKAGDLVPQALRGDQRHLRADPLVGVEVERQTRVVLLDNHARGLLHGLRADAAHLRRRLCAPDGKQEREAREREQTKDHTRTRAGAHGAARQEDDDGINTSS